MRNNTGRVKIWSDDSGNVAIPMGLLIVPMVMMIGGAVDVGRALMARSDIQAAADSGALAAASSTAPGEQDRINKAHTTFDANVNSAGWTSLNRNVSIDALTVTMNATVDVPTNFLRLAGIDSISVGARSVAKSTYDPSDTSGDNNGKICMLALDPLSTVGVAIQGDNDLRYTDCWAYSNSQLATSIQEDGNSASAVGEGHCAVGGYDMGGEGTGEQFSPRPRQNCVTAADPFANVGAYSGLTYVPKFTPPVQPTTCVANNLDLRQGDFVIRPGRYCATNTNKPALNLQARAKVRMLPGVYYFDGSVNVQSGSWLTVKESGYTSTEAPSVDGTGVLMYLAGATSTMTVQGGGTINLKGRGATSSYPGFLVISAVTALGTSNIQGGGTFNLEGVVYTPKQRILVSGNGDVNNNSPYFGMVAKDFDFRGNGMFYMRKKSSGSALPDILPEVPRQRAQDAYLSE